MIININATEAICIQWHVFPFNFEINEDLDVSLEKGAFLQKPRFALIIWSEMVYKSYENLQNKVQFNDVGSCRGSLCN